MYFTDLPPSQDLTQSNFNVGGGETRTNQDSRVAITKKCLIPLTLSILERLRRQAINSALPKGMAPCDLVISTITP